MVNFHGTLQFTLMICILTDRSHHFNWFSPQVRLGQVLENGQVTTKRLGKHQGRVYKLAVEPGSPYTLYSCGEDGFVQHVSQMHEMLLF